jgi:aldose 1-epimerase
MSQEAQISELEFVQVSHGDVTETVRVFTLSLNGVTVEVCSIGAAITKILLPGGADNGSDDVVLGYKTPAEMFASGNPPYFGVIVGRVANRIAKGRFQLDGQEFKLATNNDPNHLHGGFQGFSSRIWDMDIFQDGSRKGVECTLTSPDGDQGYPGTVLVAAKYTLIPSDSGNGVTLRLEMTAKLKDSKPSPINLAQHTYFNLGKHNHKEGILDHKMTLACESYTPTDLTSIPLRKVVAVKDDPAMDLQQGRALRDSMKLFAMLKAGVKEDDALRHVTQSEHWGPNIATAVADSKTPGGPYGFDHNYVVPRSDSSGLNLVGTLKHEGSKRRMTVHSNAPGVQIYTANYLDGTSPGPEICKEGALYGQWQGICLETQNFPDSILSTAEEAEFPDFARGRCFILRPGGPEYEHTVQYTFQSYSSYLQY